MKSLILTFIMFAVVFTLLSFNVLDIVNTDFFSYSAKILFVLVIICALLFVGVPENKYTQQLQKILQFLRRKLRLKNADGQSTQNKSSNAAPKRTGRKSKNSNRKEKNV